MSRRLLISDGTRERELQLVGRIVVGRDPTCDISHDDSLLSRRHAEFVTAEDDVTVRDLGSRNGVFVNGVRAAERSLSPGDVVQIGPLRARYVTDRASVRATLDQLNAERTAMLHPPLPPQSRAAQTDDDAVTRLIRPPRQSPARRIPGDDSSEEPTRFVRAPTAAGDSGTVAIPMRMAAAAPAVSAPSRQGVRSATGAFVFLSLLTFAGVILAAASLPLLMWRRAVLGTTGADAVSVSLLWLAVPGAVALAATYAVGVAINRRVGQALMAQHNRT